ncbi:hypothetical protein BWQ92_05170 [Arthrobacter sp. QXT-31]|nr:hypothetical protein BWQ92_05170 [Arthrobacter sp. QXT-31]
MTLSGFFSAAYGASTISPDVAPLLEAAGMGPAAETVAFVGMTVLVSYLSLVLGELVPKRLAMQSAAGFAKVLAPPLFALSQIMRPAVWLLSVSTGSSPWRTCWRNSWARSTTSTTPRLSPRTASPWKTGRWRSTAD